MTPYGLEELFRSNPNQAFRVKLNGGGEYIVDNSGRELILDLQLDVGQTDDPNSLVGRFLKILSIPNISFIEPIDRAKLFANGRRRRR